MASGVCANVTVMRPVKLILYTSLSIFLKPLFCNFITCVLLVWVLQPYHLLGYLLFHQIGLGYSGLSKGGLRSIPCGKFVLLANSVKLVSLLSGPGIDFSLSSNNGFSDSNGTDLANLLKSGRFLKYLYMRSIQK